MPPKYQKLWQQNYFQRQKIIYPLFIKKSFPYNRYIADNKLYELLYSENVVIYIIDIPGRKFFIKGNKWYTFHFRPCPKVSNVSKVLYLSLSCDVSKNKYIPTAMSMVTKYWYKEQKINDLFTALYFLINAMPYFFDTSSNVSNKTLELRTLFPDERD